MYEGRTKGRVGGKKRDERKERLDESKGKEGEWKEDRRQSRKGLTITFRVSIKSTYSFKKKEEFKSKLETLLGTPHLKP